MKTIKFKRDHWLVKFSNFNNLGAPHGDICSFVRGVLVNTVGVLSLILLATSLAIILFVVPFVGSADMLIISAGLWIVVGGICRELAKRAALEDDYSSWWSRKITKEPTKDKQDSVITEMYKAVKNKTCVQIKYR